VHDCAGNGLSLEPRLLVARLGQRVRLEAQCGADVLKLVLNKVVDVLGEGQWLGLRNPAQRLAKPTGGQPPGSLHGHDRWHTSRHCAASELLNSTTQRCRCAEEEEEEEEEEKQGCAAERLWPAVSARSIAPHVFTAAAEQGRC